jgi:hypothetical protein
MPTRRCCCGNCRIGEDDFDRANANAPTGNWHVISGEWEILDNELNCITPGVLATTICHPPQYDKGSYIARFDLIGMSDGSVDHWEIGVGDPNSPNYVVEILHTFATSTAVLKLWSGNKSSLIHEETYSGVNSDAPGYICYAPGIAIDVSIGRIPELEFCDSTTSSDCFESGDTDTIITQSGSLVTGASITGQATGTTLYGIVLRNEDGEQDSAILLFSSSATRASYDISSSTFNPTATGLVASFTSTNSVLGGGTYSLVERNSSGISGSVSVTGFTQGYEFEITKTAINDVGGFSFRDGRFDNWTYDLHWLDLKRCEKCPCFCEKSNTDYSCYPTELTLSFISVGTTPAILGSITLIQSFLSPITPWTEKVAWYSEVQNCGSPVGASYTVRFLCGQDNLGTLTFGTVDYEFENPDIAQIVFGWDDGLPLPDVGPRFAIKPSSTCSPLYLVFPRLVVNAAFPSPICFDPPCDTDGCYTPYCTNLNDQCYEAAPDIAFTPVLTI